MPQVALFFRRVSFAVALILSQCVYRQLSTKNFSRLAPAELRANGFPTALGARFPARQFEGFVYVDGQQLEENQDVNVFHLSEKLENVSKWGLCRL